MKRLFSLFLIILYLFSCLTSISADNGIKEITSKNATIFYYYSFDYFLTKNPENEIPILYKYNDNYEYNIDIDNLNKFSNIDSRLHIDESKLKRIYSIIKSKNLDSDLSITYNTREDYQYIRIQMNKDVYYDFDGQLLIGTYNNQDIELNDNFEIIGNTSLNKSGTSIRPRVEMDSFLEYFGIDKYIRNLVSSSLEDYFKEVFSTENTLNKSMSLAFIVQSTYLSTVISNGNYNIQKGDSEYNQYNLSIGILADLFPTMKENLINTTNMHICYFYIYDEEDDYEPVDFRNEMNALAFYWMFSRRIIDSTWILNSLDKKYDKLNLEISNEANISNKNLESKINQDLKVVLACENNNFFFKQKYETVYNELIFKENDTYSHRYTNDIQSINNTIPYLTTLIKEKRKLFIDRHYMNLWNQQFSSNSTTYRLSIFALIVSIVSAVLSIITLSKKNGISRRNGKKKT